MASTFVMKRIREVDLQECTKSFKIGGSGLPTLKDPSRINALHWFRKGLRLHDNPALLRANEFATLTRGTVYPVFCLDDHFLSPETVGTNRMSFLLCSLKDLDQTLRALGSRLYLLRGNPAVLLAQYLQEWQIGMLTFESDFEPYARVRDAQVIQTAQSLNVLVERFATHTLYDPDVLRSHLSSPTDFPKTYQSFVKLLEKVGPPAAPLPQPEALATAPTAPSLTAEVFSIPSLSDIGYPESPTMTFFAGGESEALSRMHAKLADAKYIKAFSKPATSPCSLSPSTTLLSPHLKFGALSPRLYYHSLCRVMGIRPAPRHPPETLLGQLTWREFFTMTSIFTPNFDQIEGNPICRPIGWSAEQPLLDAWRNGQTGYPWIDAAMRQLHKEGWMHHLARHCVACFLTRGDLWQSWVEGRKVFDTLLVDADWALNSANWMWVSCSSFFHQFHRVYSPVAFPKKYPESPAFIKHYVPELAKMPDKYIFEPWTAPRSIQEAAHCIIGVDYPSPIVDHALKMAENKNKMAVYFSGASKNQN